MKRLLVSACLLGMASLAFPGDGRDNVANRSFACSNTPNCEIVFLVDYGYRRTVAVITETAPETYDSRGAVYVLFQSEEDTIPNRKAGRLLLEAMNESGFEAITVADLNPSYKDRMFLVTISVTEGSKNAIIIQIIVGRIKLTRSPDKSTPPELIDLWKGRVALDGSFYSANPKYIISKLIAYFGASDRRGVENW